MSNLLFNLSISSLLTPLVFFIIFLFKWLYDSTTPQKKQPPSPSKLPIIGNLHQLGLLPHRSLQSLSQKYGPLMMLHLGSKPVLVVSSSDAACEIMKTHDIIFSNRPKSAINDKFTYGSKNVVFAPYSEYWRQVRSICVLQLLSNKRVESFRGVREEETSIMINKIKRIITSQSFDCVINLREIFVTLTNDIICRVAFGKKYSNGEKGRKFMASVAEALELTGVFNIGDYFPWLSWVNHFNGFDAKIEKVAKEMDECLEGVIEEHRTRKNKEAHDDDGTIDEARGLDFVDTLFRVQKETLTCFALESDSLKAIILDMFAAGTDTTHTLMEWAMAELLKHPHILEKLQIEVRQVGEGKSEISEDDLEKMPYLRAVIKESLRLHAPLPLLVPRESTQNIEIMGYDIPKGTMVSVNAWAIARDPFFWEKPEEFQPERFLNSNVNFRGLNFEFIPFGAGRRGCPGISFGVAVNELALAKLVHQFNFSLPDGANPEVLDMTEAPAITVHKKLPILVVAKPTKLDEQKHR